MTNIEKELETLRTNYPYTKIHLYDDCMVLFDLTEKTSPIVEKELNNLITKLNLNLIAEQSSPYSAIRKCVFVKEKI